MKLYDIFISHAGEDKDALVRPLATRLEHENLKVWYDEFELCLGDSLRRSIDRGLRQSRYGIVVLSEAFFSKEWPQRELDGLVALATSGGSAVILPIWHDISKEQICHYSPTIADLIAVPSNVGIDRIVHEIIKVVRPDGSPLIIARDILVDKGCEPPVVTDEWWLDVVEASNREVSWGFVPERECWGRWTFPLPYEEEGAQARGERLAWTALQLNWERHAEENRISQITPPDKVLDFMASYPGLSEMAHDHPSFLATYAPQLTIEGFGGDYESDMDWLLARSTEKYMEYHRNDSSFGSATTTNNKPPLCEELIALRHPSFGNLGASYVACQFVQGELGGAQCKVYETIDYVLWLLSESSGWLPPKIRVFLLKGMKDWIVWPWTHSAIEIELGLGKYPDRGAFLDALLGAEKYSDFHLNHNARNDMTHRFRFTRQLLHLPEREEELVEMFIREQFIERYYLKRRARSGDTW